MTKMRNFKNKLVLASLMSSLALTGCGKTNKNTVNEATTQEAVITTEQQTPNHQSISEKSFEEYKTFYRNLGLDIEDVKQIERFINGDFSGMSEEDMIETSTNIRKMLYSDQLQSSIRAVNDGVEFVTTPEKMPSLVDFVDNEDVKQELIEFESIRNKIANEVAQGKITDATKQELIDFAIDTHLESYSNGYEIYDDENEIGLCYVQNEWREQLFNLVAVTTNQSEITNDRLKGHSIKVAPATVEESDLLNLYMVYAEDAPEDKKEEIANLLNQMVWYQFSRNNTNILNKIISEPTKKEDCTISKQEIIDSYKAKKAILTAYNYDSNTYKLHM